MFAENCYLLGEGEGTWANGRAWCKHNNSRSDLVSIHSPLENDHVWGMMHDISPNMWLGLSDQGEEGTWLWSDGTNSTNFQHWHSGEPNGETRENCAHMRIDGDWNDLDCTKRNSFMCKVAALGELDGGDTLPTTPSGSEACQGYEGQWYEDSMTGMCYQVLDIALTWAEAREECSYRGGWRRGGDLASINSLQEQTFMRSKTFSPPSSFSHCHHCSLAPVCGRG